MNPPRKLSRRAFLTRSTMGAAGLGLAGVGLDVGFGGRELESALPRARGQFPVVASEPWGRILRIADRVWALESDPLTDRTTLCNGGIVAGRAGVVMIEAFGSDEGARWMARQAERLAGRPPTHVVLTHHHADHTSGLRGATETRGLEILATAATLERVAEASGTPEAAPEADVTVIGDGRPTELDLGDRSLLLVPRRGHTASDLTVEVFDAPVVFAGDLVWNGMFPNYVDASPGRLSRTVRVLRARGAEIYVTGHGALADGEALDRYIDLLDHVEGAARTAAAEGWSAAEAAARYRLPAEMEDWTLFDPGYVQRALGAWLRELEG
ncbi:MAG: MBL fold metallo-hydrolase [Gemmatimonadota bacterium]|nr:MBL fold metallo-hydrolase [Gemmatimonadota bacterium]